MGQEDPVSLTFTLHGEAEEKRVVKDGESKEKIEKPLSLRKRN
jgi:hypothetical protein